ncbi:MAG TPA: hypothetical protein VNQ90_20420 [Chthoniobacteraceae bacterium]|nr:hypothetical protein [Chthoniobacteraceae bacterium]
MNTLPRSRPPFGWPVAALAIVAALAFGAFCANAGAADREVVWTGLIYATNEGGPDRTPAVLAPYARQIKKVFGYNRLQLLGEQRKVMDRHQKQWSLVPGKGFVLQVDSRKKGTRGCHLHLALSRQKKLLVKTDAMLAPHSPLFFRGPLYGRGQLIIAVMVE